MSLSFRFTYRRVRVALVCAAAAGAWHTSAAQQQRLADSLTDREFWQFFTRMSEESGTFPSENFVSNEKMYQYVIPTLERTLTPNGVYLGVGPEQNFSYIVNLKPRMAVIFDIRRQNAMTHLMYKALFELSPTRIQFVSRLFSRPLRKSLGSGAMASEIFAAVGPVSDSAFEINWKAIVQRLTVTHGFALSNADLQAMQHVFTTFAEAGPEISYAYHLGAPPSPTPWLATYAELMSATNADGTNMAFLATEENYRWLRALEARNMVVPVVGDFGGPKAIRSVGEYLTQRGAVVTAFYVSNVEQYLFSTGFGADERFYQSVETLPIDSTSRFIRSLPAGVTPTPLPSGLVPPNSTRVLLQTADSGGVRIWTATITDSTGKSVTTRAVVSIPPATAASTSAFVSGISSIRRVLDAFAGGQLKTYGQVNALTKTEGWNQPPL
jgi:hypothetical protein